MAIEERERLALYDELSTILPNHAGTLMALLPPTDELATRTDLAVQGKELRTEMSELRTELRADISAMGARLELRIAEQTRLLVLAMIGFAITVWLTIAAAAVWG